MACCVYLQDGVHQCEDPTPQYTDAQLKLIASQDLKYVNYKRSVEQNVCDQVFCVPPNLGSFIHNEGKVKTKYIRLKICS